MTNPDGRPSTRPARAYAHDACGGTTRVSGYDFQRLANPFAFVHETVCCGCNRAVPIRRVVWTDTGEGVAAYRKRLRAAVPVGRRWFFLALGPAAGGALGFLGGFVGGMVMIGRFGNRPWWRQPEPGLIGGLVGSFAGAILGAQMLPPLLMRRVWGIDYRGVD